MKSIGITFVAGLLAAGTLLVAGTLTATPARADNCNDYARGSNAQNDCFTRKGRELNRMNNQWRDCQSADCRQRVDTRVKRKSFEAKTD
jgi:hypothetical protein